MRRLTISLQRQNRRLCQLAGFLLLVLFALLSLTGCSAGYLVDKFRLPLENDKIYWGIQESDFETVMQKFDYEVSPVEQGQSSTFQTYAITSPLKTGFGDAADSQFLFDDSDELVMVRFFYTTLSLEELNAKLTETYGSLSRTDTPVTADDSYTGEYYTPQDATPANLSDKDYQKLKEYLVAHASIVNSDAKAAGDELGNAVDTFLQSASVFTLKTGTYQDSVTLESGAYVEISGEYLALLSGLS